MNLFIAIECAETPRIIGNSGTEEGAAEIAGQDGLVIRLDGMQSVPFQTDSESPFHWEVAAWFADEMGVPRTALPYNDPEYGELAIGIIPSWLPLP